MRLDTLKDWAINACIILVAAAVVVKIADTVGLSLLEVILVTVAFVVCGMIRDLYNGRGGSGS